MKYRLIIQGYRNDIHVVPYLFDTRKQAEQYLYEFVSHYRDYEIISESRYQWLMGNVPKPTMHIIKPPPKQPQPKTKIFSPPTSKPTFRRKK